MTVAEQWAEHYPVGTPVETLTIMEGWQPGYTIAGPPQPGHGGLCVPLRYGESAKAWPIFCCLVRRLNPAAVSA